MHPFSHRRLVTRAILVVMLFIGMPTLAQELNQRTLAKAALDIRIKNQNVTKVMLANDQKVIASSFPDIEAKLVKKGFSATEVNDAIATGWKDLRSPSSPVVHFEASVFRDYVTKLGKLKFESAPNGANIDINGTRLDEKTNSTKWLAPNRYKIVLFKDGYYPEEEERNVVEGENPPLIKKLRPKSKNAP